MSKRITDEELLDDLKHRCQKLGRQPRPSEISRNLGKYSLTPYITRFGSLEKALERAGCADYPKPEKHIWKLNRTYDT